jgi:hypothetical protein
MNGPVPGSAPSGPLLPAGIALLADFSLDITAKELGELEPARAVLPAGTQVQLAFPDGGDLAGRVSTARAVKGAGFAVSVPGPASVRRLLACASRCGVALSGPVAGEYGFSLTAGTGAAGPDRFIRTLASGYDPRLHGEARLHLNAFGGFLATAEWISRFRGRQIAADDTRTAPSED